MSDVGGGGGGGGLQDGESFDGQNTSEFSNLKSLGADVAVLASELGLPQYDDVANAPQTQGRVVYATGAGASAEGIWKHNGTAYEQVGGAGGAFEDTDSDGVAELQDDHTDHQGGDARNIGVADAAELNGTVWVGPSEDIQTVLNGLTVPSDPEVYNWVKLTPGVVYNRSTTLVVPQQTILDLNGGGILHGADVDAISLSAPGAYLYGPGNVTAWGSSLTYTSNLVKVDTASGNFSNHLQPQNQNTVGIRGFPHLRCNDPDSTLVLLDSSGQQILSGNLFEVMAQGGNHAVEFRANNGNAINAVEVRILGWSGFGQHIARTNTAGAAGPVRSEVYGYLQGGSNAQSLLANTVADTKAFNFYGQLWDAHLVTGDAITGQGLRVRSPTVGNGSVVNFGTGTVVNGISEQNLGGAGPDATNYVMGDIVRDLDNAGDAYLVLGNDAAGNFTQIGT